MQLLWRHEYHDTALQSVSNFAADTSGATTFTANGPKPLNNTAVLSLGATLARSQNMTLSAHYTVEAGSAYTAQTADVRLRYQF
jgi:outer membrane autotransporter protein